MARTMSLFFFPSDTKIFAIYFAFSALKLDSNASKEIMKLYGTHVSSGKVDFYTKIGFDFILVSKSSTIFL